MLYHTIYFQKNINVRILEFLFHMNFMLNQS